MRGFVFGVLVVLGLLAGAAAWVWHCQPERLPQEWRRQNPNSRDYMPPLYRWKDDQGRVQLTDAPPEGRPYEVVRIDPNRNIVPTTLPPPGATR
ncbi:DUF4124 domain-containing protein [Xanthomonadaceae bacterium JHOS43]|nr:DUF4124 domain-containing protein [Xanthomonadaceae bacterium JHOS43]MCX7562709.1 DUF4124 domain-containing protein [Xanthomonadaceae bacterium XH05]